ncbi:MAG TPA: DUF2442 domain-containing protein [Candidatus Dojkabacteria bacterium]|nr:DUF2442 domain-containing protein [Candidatus Dojkabacteria bacterium]
MVVPKVKKVEVIKKYQILVGFEDGTEGIYDLSSLSGKGVFQSWDKEDNFFKVYINLETGTITWPGNLDVDTLNIYCKIKGITPKDYLENLKQHATY